MRRSDVTSTVPTAAPPVHELPPRVAIYALAVPVVISLVLTALYPEGVAGPGEIVMSTARLSYTLLLELVLTGVLGSWLWSHGWRPHRTATLPWSLRDFARALGLWLAATAAYWCWAIICNLVAPAFTAGALGTRIVGRPAPAVVVVLSLFNAVFEEFLWLALGVAALRRFGVARAAAPSVTLRLLVHVYQGPVALVGILPLGVVFTWYYVRTRRLWPVVLAHAFQDLLALGLLAVRASTGVAAR